jgi:hypothetical protein
MKVEYKLQDEFLKSQLENEDSEISRWKQFVDIVVNKESFKSLIHVACLLFLV